MTSPRPGALVAAPWVAYIGLRRASKSYSNDQNLIA
jgi:hypothetical protein